MADTGLVFPGTGNTDTSYGAIAWSYYSRITANDDNYATASFFSSGGSAITHYLCGYNFGFSIPAGSTIDGIVAVIRRKAGYSTLNMYVLDNIVRLGNWGGSLFGDNKADTSTKWPTSEGSKTYGGSTDLWGKSDWTAEFVNNSTFGLALVATIRSKDLYTVTAYVDSFELQIYYTAPPGYSHSVTGVAASSISAVGGVAIANISTVQGV